jgi:hypothetical protein
MFTKIEVLAQMQDREAMMAARLAWFDAEPAAISCTDVNGQVWDRAQTALALAQVREAIAYVTAH